MNERHLRKIRNQFILVSTLSFFGVMLLMGGLIYAFSEVAVRNEVRQIMSVIVENDGEIPDSGTSATYEAREFLPTAPTDGTLTEEELNALMEWNLQQLFGRGNLLEQSPDYIRSTSYFAVLFDAEGEAERVTASHIWGLDGARAVRFARMARDRRSRFGSIGCYYYGVFDRADEGEMVIYIDRTGQVSSMNRILFSVLTILGVGTILAFFLMRVLSVRIVRSEVKNAERQRQFITNASHELKTPLAVIRANTEMQEMTAGETEWTSSTMRQVARMSGLVENLVKIARADERGSVELARVDAAHIVAETADSFVPVAEGDGKRLTREIETPLEFVTDESLLRQLLTLLLDNAVKYCDEGGAVSCRARRSGKALELSVSNDFAAGKSVDYSRFFDRFYRADSSHNTDRGGYGIGLSIAEGIVKSLRGEIDVFWKDGVITFRVTLRERRR
ncbi:MAG: GHKL domain-containing protein [Ruminococcaceae bacterium]|nr:GHKL domain-containing protein [Oscillospiraceae bacterium]